MVRSVRMSVKGKWHKYQHIKGASVLTLTGEGEGLVVHPDNNGDGTGRAEVSGKIGRGCQLGRPCWWRTSPVRVSVMTTALQVKGTVR